MEKINERDIGGLAKTGASWTLLQTITKQVLSIGSTALLARLLNPDDYGLIGMVATLTVLLNTFQDMGLSWVTLQNRTLTKEQSDNLFWLNVLIGALLWPLCLPGGILLEYFYGRPELRLLVPAMGVLFLIDGIGAQPKALLSRSLKIKSLTKIELLSHILGIVTAVIGAFSGWRYWSLVAQSFVQQFSRLLMVLIVSKYRPSLPKRGVGTWKLVGLGGAIAGFGLLTYFSRNVDSMLIGKLLGATELGYYSRAYFLMVLPSQLVTASFGSVMIPTLSAVYNDKIRLRAIYTKTFQAIALFAWPIALGMNLTSHELVRFIYGEKWLHVTPILFWLSLASLSQTLYHTTGWLFVTSGKKRLMLNWAFINAAILVTGFFYGIHNGAVGVAKIFFILSTFVLTVPALWMTHREVGMQTRESLKSLVPVIICCFIMSLSVLGVERVISFPSESWRLNLFVKVTVGVFTYSIAAFLILKNLPVDRLQQFRKKTLGW